MSAHLIETWYARLFVVASSKLTFGTAACQKRQSFRWTWTIEKHSDVRVYLVYTYNWTLEIGLIWVQHCLPVPQVAQEFCHQAGVISRSYNVYLASDAVGTGRLPAAGAMAHLIERGTWVKVALKMSYSVWYQWPSLMWTCHRYQAS